MKMLELNRVYNMDCADGLSLLPDNSVDLIVTSPPYDNLRSYGQGIDCSWNESKWKPIIQQLHRIIKDGGVVVWVVSDATLNGSETGTSFRQALHFMDVGFRLHDTMIYRKINYIPLTHDRYEQCWEYMFVFSKGRLMTFNPIKIKCKGAGRVETGGTQRRKVLDPKQAMGKSSNYSMVTKDTKIHPNMFDYACGLDRTGHPAAFPSKLARDMIYSWSNEGDIVLDPFMGSGTTAVEAVKLNRSFIGFELSKDYTYMANKRLRDLTGPFKLYGDIGKDENSNPYPLGNAQGHLGQA